MFIRHEIKLALTGTTVAALAIAAGWWATQPPAPKPRADAFAIIRQTQAPNPFHENVVAAITLKSGKKIGDRCEMSQLVQTLEIRADGTVFQKQRNRQTACAGGLPQPRKRLGMSMQGSFSYPTRQLQLQVSQVEGILSALREHQSRAHERARRHPSKLSQLAQLENEHSLAISVSDDRIGTPAVSELSRVLDSSKESLQIGYEIVAAIEQAAKIGPTAPPASKAASAPAGSDSR